jgi:hypothetical protein
VIDVPLSEALLVTLTMAEAALVMAWAWRSRSANLAELVPLSWVASILGDADGASTAEGQRRPKLTVSPV